MPYLEEKTKEMFTRALARMPVPIVAGELNFLFTYFINQFLLKRGMGNNPVDMPRGKPRYADYNEAMGALECAKFELYRRLIAPYEDTKLKENGDVY